VIKLREIKLFSMLGKAFTPKKLRPLISRQFFRAGLSDVPNTLFGILFYITLIITYFIYFPNSYLTIRDFNPILFLFITFLFWVVVPLTLSAITMLGIYFYLDIKIFNRSKSMEDKLADYLVFVSTNLKGGMSFEASLWSAIKPEFGLLAEEMGLVSKKVMTGSDLVTSLTEFAQKYPSPIIRRSMNLIISEIESGGKISDLIDRVISDLKKTRLLKQEMAASTLTYIIFISVIILIISPLLFALSYQLLDVMISFMGRFAGMNIPNMPISFAEGEGVDPTQFKIFSYFAISIISIFASMIISIINKGTIKSGLKYMPMFLATSIIVYIITQSVLAGVFSSLVI
jgi:pilus assembly protein TadC